MPRRTGGLLLAGVGARCAALLFLVAALLFLAEHRAVFLPISYKSITSKYLHIGVRRCRRVLQKTVAIPQRLYRGVIT